MRLSVTRIHQTLPSLVGLLQRERAELSQLVTHHATLEDVFISLTGRHLRDG
jgi:ABC-2 type transport system ATP-binding protein